MPSAPPRCASTAAQTGSGSYVRRAWRNVATWSMFTPSSITIDAPSWNVALVVERLQVLHHAAAEDAPRLEIMIQHQSHQTLGFRGGLGVGITLLREREQRGAAHDRPACPRLGRIALRTAVESVMVALGRIDHPARVDLARQRERVPELRQQPQLEASEDHR